MLFREDKETNGHTDGRTNMDIKGAVCNWIMDVRKMSQKLSVKTKNFGINFHLAGTINCWYEGALISP